MSWGKAERAIANRVPSGASAPTEGKGPLRVMPLW